MNALAKFRDAVDVDAYFAHVADGLVAEMGDGALPAAEQALTRMRLVGDDLGFEMWLGIQDKLVERIGPAGGAVPLH